MKALKVLAIGLLATVAIVTINKSSASAATACEIQANVPVTVQDHGKNFVVNEAEGTVSATFKVVGDENCRKQAVFATWIMPNATGQPWESQKFYDYASKINTTYGPGVHTITANLPKCDYWQLDLLEGSDPKGINGTAFYGNLLDPLSPDNTSRPGYRRNIIDTKLGGAKRDCTPPPVDVCPNIANMQTTVPTGYTRDANGNCVVTTAPPTDLCPNIANMQTAVPAGYTRDANGNCVATPAPAELPKTGPASTVSLFGAVSGLGYAVSRLKKRFQ